MTVPEPLRKKFCWEPPHKARHNLNNIYKKDIKINCVMMGLHCIVLNPFFRAEFEEYPLVKSFFFTVGMQFHQQNQGVLHTRKGILVLSLGFTRPTAFTFKLGIGDAVIETMQVSLFWVP